MSKTLWIAVIGSALLASSAFASTDTTSCQGKRSWQRQIVQDAVGRWFDNQPDPDDLISLVQAEQGIVACSAGSGPGPRLHTTRLPTGLGLDQFGAVLLANELEWRRIIPRPEAGLAGEYFRVRPNKASDEVGDALPASDREYRR